MENHGIKKDDPEYEVTVHPAFASRCTVAGKDGQARELYRQTKAYELNGRPIPAAHTIRLKAKNGGKRDIAIQVNDPAHSIARITVELYEDSHDPATAVTASETDTVFTVENHAKLCPPNCDT